MANRRRTSAVANLQRQQQAMARQAEQVRKAAERARIAAAKADRERYLERRRLEVENQNKALSALVDQLSSVLINGLTRSARIDLGSLRRKSTVPPLRLGDLANPLPIPDWREYAPASSGPISRLFGGAKRYQRKLTAAKMRFENDRQVRDQAEIERQRKVVVARSEHAERAKQEENAVRIHNAETDKLVQALGRRDKRAVEWYFGMVLSRVPLPAGFLRNAEVAFSQQNEQLVVRFELPSRDVVPTIASYQFLSTKDDVRSSQRKAKDVSDLYRSVISQVALICIRDLFNSDRLVASIGFNGHVHAINPGTGQREYPCMISLNVERPSFPPDANLSQVTAEVCVRHLKAIVSSHPYDLEAIEPILDFDLTKYSFVDGLDAVATLDSRPDLMQMSYTNFEHLVRQLFEAQGLVGWTTQQSNDDGVDAVIANKTSIVGGLAIVQAKRYKDAVGVSHVRELAGAMEEKKAGKGILVTTSWFTPKCWEKARDHGRMELIDGERLKFLIKEHLGKDILIGIAKRPQSPHRTSP